MSVTASKTNLLPGTQNNTTKCNEVIHFVLKHVQTLLPNLCLWRSRSFTFGELAHIDRHSLFANPIFAHLQIEVD